MASRMSRALAQFRDPASLGLSPDVAQHWGQLLGALQQAHDADVAELVGRIDTAMGRDGGRKEKKDYHPRTSNLTSSNNMFQANYPPNNGQKNLQLGHNP